MFENLRQSLDDLLARATKPEDRRAVITQMKDALVHARVAVDDMRRGVRETQLRLDAERRELDTVVRRKGLAAGINDAETVAIAERYERQHGERVRVLEAKLEAQQAELALAEREVEQMGTELRGAIAGVPGAPGTPAGHEAAAAREVDDLLHESGAGRDPLAPDANLESEISAAARAGRRARQEQEADARLAELKRRMGK